MPTFAVVAPLPRPVADLTQTYLHEVDGRLPGRLAGLFLHGSLGWGEFFAVSDVDFVCVWHELPRGAELDLLEEAHRATSARHPAPAYDGFHCTTDDLAADPTTLGPRPVHYQGVFSARGGTDINPVTWHELAQRPVVVRGHLPTVRTDPAQLARFTRDNLDTYWRSLLEQLTAEGPAAVGTQDDAVAWTVLGCARLHHLLTRGELTSKSGAGRHVLAHLDVRWHRVAREALRVRERPGSPGLYDDAGHRGQDTLDLLEHVVSTQT